LLRCENSQTFWRIKNNFPNSKISEKSARCSNDSCIRGALIVPDSEDFGALDLAFGPEISEKSARYPHHMVRIVSVHEDDFDRSARIS